MGEILNPGNCGAYMDKEWGTRKMSGICGIRYGGGTGDNPRPGLANELAACPVLSGGTCVVANRSAMNDVRIQDALKIAQQDATNTLTALSSENI